MTDTQLLTLAIAIIVPLSMLLYSNSRITEAKETLRAEIKGETAALSAAMAVMRAETEALRTEIRNGFERMETMLKIHELEHHAK